MKIPYFSTIVETFRWLVSNRHRSMFTEITVVPPVPTMQQITDEATRLWKEAGSPTGVRWHYFLKADMRLHVKDSTMTATGGKTVEASACFGCMRHRQKIAELRGLLVECRGYLDRMGQEGVRDRVDFALRNL